MGDTEAIKLHSNHSATIFPLHEKACISYEGEPVEVYYFRASLSVPVCTVAKLGQVYCQILHQDTVEAESTLNAPIPGPATSAHVSLLASRVSRIRSFVKDRLESQDYEEVDLLLNQLLDGAVDAFHGLCSRSEKIESKFRNFRLQANSNRTKKSIGRGQMANTTEPSASQNKERNETQKTTFSSNCSPTALHSLQSTIPTSDHTITVHVDHPIVTLDHPIEATIYKKHGKSYISEEGRELEIIDYKPSKWSDPIQVVQRGVYHCPVGHKPTTGVYNGNSPLWRISHNISRFATQIGRLKTLLPSTEHQLDLDIMIEEISDGFHDDSSEISRLSSKLRTMIQSSHSSGKIVLVEKKKVDDFAKLMKYRESGKNGLPILHYACLEGMSPSIIDMLVEEFGNEALKSMVKIGREESKKIGLSHARTSFGEWQVTCTPLHLAILCGHVELVQHLAKHYSQCAAVEMHIPRIGSYDVLALSAFSPLDNCQSMLAIFGSDRIMNVSQTVEMALLGGNLELLQRLPTLCSLSFEELFRKNHGFLWKYWYLAAVGGHLSLVEWIFKNYRSFSAKESQTSSNGKNDINHTSMNQIDEITSLEYRQSFWKWSRFIEIEICQHATDHLPIMKWICQHSYMTKDERYRAISKSEVPLLAAKNGSEEVFLWLSKNPQFDPSFVGTYAHMACISDYDGILKILFDWALQRRVGNSEPNLSFFHLRASENRHIAHIAALNGSLKCLQWMTTHLEEFKGRKGQNYFLALKKSDGASVLHMAARSGSIHVLLWLHEAFEPNWTSVDEDGYQPIHYACDSLSTIRWLYDTAGVTNLDALTKGGHHLAWLAASAGNFEVLDFIVSKVGPPCLIPNENRLGFAPVQECISQDPIRLLEWLVKVGYDFSLVDHNGDTIAHRIASYAYNDKYLTALEWIKAHSKLTFKEKNKKNKTVLDLLDTKSSPLFSAFMKTIGGSPKGKGPPHYVKASNPKQLLEETPESNCTIS